MSSHYIAIACPHPACSTLEQVYTGDKFTDDFPDSGWEGGWIYTPCNDHLGWMGYKRLSDAELAAEVWKSRAELDKDVEQSRHHHMCETIERFATTPHYDEVG